MSKITPLPRIDRDYQKNLKFPDINDFLKDTSYLEVTSALQDNQSHVVLQPKLSNSVPPVLMQNFIVDGVKRLFYMTPIEFYGYNPDLESVERAELTVEFLEATVPRKAQLLYRGDGDDRIVTLPGQRAAGNGDNLYNYKIQLSVATVESILTWVFNTQKTLAQGYYAGDYRNLQQFIDSDFYTMAVPVTFRMYYFNATEAAVVYSTSLAFGSLTTVLRSSLTATSAVASYYPQPSTDRLQNYLTVKAAFAAPITTNALWLTATISGTSLSATEQFTVTAGAFAAQTGLLRSKVARQAHSDYSVKYPTISFNYSANSEAFTGNASISGVALTSFTPTKFYPIMQSLKITDYFIGHPTNVLGSTTVGVPYDSTNFRVRLAFTIPRYTVDLGSKSTFMLEFMKPDNAKTEIYDAAGQVTTTVLKDKLMIRGTIPTGSFAVNRNPEYETSYTSASGTLGTIYRSAYFDEVNGVYNSTVQKIFNEARNEVKYAHSSLGAFTTSLRYWKTDSAVEDTYILSLEWTDSNVASALFLAAELPIIRLTIGDFLHQFYAQGTFNKSTADNYVRADNPFYYYVNPARTLKWYPRISAIQVNGATLTGLVKGGVTALDATSVTIPTTAQFYKLTTSANLDLSVTYAMRLYCRGYARNPLLLLNNTLIINKDAKGFKIPYVKLPGNTGVVELTESAVSTFTVSFTKSALDNLNVTQNKSPRSYFLTNLKLVTLADKSTYYTYSYTGANVPQCDIGFYYDKI
jgi:hypothetical protein